MEIKLDVYNPAEFYGVLGVMTVLSLQHPQSDIMSHFEVSGRRGENNATFIVSSDADLSLERVINDLKHATVTEDKSANVWNNKEITNAAYFTPVTLSSNGWSIVLDWWLDELRYEASGLKCWSGTAAPKTMLESFVKNCENAGEINSGGSTFGFDTRSSRDALEMGYSMKDTGEKTGVYPQTELLCAIGLQNYRPRQFAYYAWQKAVPISITHGAAIEEIKGLQQVRYEFEVQMIGKGVKQVVPVFANLSGSATA
jgi:CRISPR-associated protein Csb3